jgi:hypothetical protein
MLILETNLDKLFSEAVLGVSFDDNVGFYIYLNLLLEMVTVLSYFCEADLSGYWGNAFFCPYLSPFN